MPPGADAAQWYANGIAVVALIASVIGVFLNAAIAYLAVTQAKAAQASADAARESVRVAQQSVDQAKGALEIGNRAWVHVDRIDPHSSSSEEAVLNKQIALRPDVVLRNFGPTPALALIAECRIAVFLGFPTAEEIHFEPTDNAGVSVVSPNNEFWVPTVSIAFTLNNWAVLTRGEKKLILFGRAHYNDIFGRPHQSTWLYWYDTEKAGGFVPGPFNNFVT